MPTYNLKEGRKYHEGKNDYIGPCTVTSKHVDLHKRFPDSFTKVEEVETEPQTEETKEDSKVSFKRGDKDTTAEYGENEDFSTPNLTPKHKGGGRWNVLKDDGEYFNSELLSKKEAYEMCGLNLED